MIVLTLRTLSLPLALAAMFSGAAAHAETPAATTAPAPRTDVRTACPGIDIALQDSLQRVWTQHQQPSLVRVLMQVEGGRVVGVKTVGGLYPYSSPIKRAVQRLECPVAGDGPQQFSFQVRFAHDADVVTAASESAAGS